MEISTKQEAQWPLANLMRPVIILSGIGILSVGLLLMAGPEFITAAQGDGPLAVGFGISTREQVQAVGKLADGVIVGSALIKAVDGAADKPAAAAQFVRALMGH